MTTLAFCPDGKRLAFLSTSTNLTHEPAGADSNGPFGIASVPNLFVRDLAAGALRQRWTFVLPDGTRRERHSLVRLYLPHELARLLAEAGFDAVEFLGGIDGEPLELDSPRCIALARRPA